MSIIASASNDLKFHHWPEGTVRQSYMSLKMDEGPIKSISWSRDGSWLVLVPSFGPAELVSIKDSVKLLQTLQDVHHPTCATFQNSTKRNIAVGTLAGQVLLYDIKARGVRKRFPRAASAICGLQYNAKDSHIAAACASGEILVFSNTTATLSSSYKVPRSDNVSALCFHRSKRNLLAAGSEEGVVATWDINTSAVQCDLQAHHAPVTGLTFSPMRSDLLVTSGLDRRFAFYDLLAKKCILEVEVSSSITALDFSYCGLYLGLGSQNGNVVLYDTRNFSKPISAFPAHDGKRIWHLLFQKVPMPDGDQNCSTYEAMEQDVPQSQQEQVQECNEVDSLGLALCNDSATQAGEEAGSTNVATEVKDSFLVAMGMDNSSQSEASFHKESTIGLGITEEVKKWMDASKRSSIHQNLMHVPESKTSVHNPSFTLKQSTSTPKFVAQALPTSTVSPIAGPTFNSASSPADCAYKFNVSPKDLKEMIREVVKEELQVQLDDHRADTLGVIRRHVLDLQMTIVKEFVAMEDRLEKMNGSMVREFVCDNYLISENDRLQKELDALKEQMVERDLCNRRKF